MMKRPLMPALMLSTALLVAGCESAEDRAESYYQSALSLMAEGDEERALIELRNVFEYDGFHQEARLLYADTLLERGQTQQAYSQYLLLVEQYPNTPEVRLKLAELAVLISNWDEARRHGTAALALVPDDPRARALGATLDYQQAFIDNNEQGKTEAVDIARAVLIDAPDSLIARRLVIEELLNSDTPSDAISEIDTVLSQDPMLLEFHITKLQLLVTAGREEEAGAQLTEMYRLFPEEPEVRASIVQWSIVQGDMERTEALLREMAGPITAAPDGHVALLQFLEQVKGPEAAIAELDILIAANEGTEHLDTYRGMRTVNIFNQGEQARAISELQDIVETASPSIQTRRLKIVLSQLMVQTNDIVGARSLVEEVLAEDGANVDALKMRAGWRLAGDDPDGAISDLRVALGQAPRDPGILTLMGEAHLRTGQMALAGERFARAVEASGSTADTAMRYARFLLGQGERRTALQVLSDARRAAPGNLDVLGLLADIYLADQNWAELANIRQELMRSDLPQAQDLATSLQTAVLMSQNRTDEALDLLRTTLEGASNEASAQIVIISTQLRSGRVEEARVTMDAALAASPDDPGLQMLNGSLLSVEGDLDGAEAVIRGVVEAYPTEQTPTVLLYGLLNAQGRGDDAIEALDTVLAANPMALQALVPRAALHERAGEFAEAIALYDAFYSQDNRDIRVANNLASLLSSYSDDPADLERARNIGRRLGPIQNPAVQDTFGWIAYQQGNYAEALDALEPAAAGLPDEPVVQFHLGMVYAALDRKDPAIEALTRALQLGEGRNLPQMAVARETLEALQASE